MASLGLLGALEGLGKGISDSATSMWKLKAQEERDKRLEELRRETNRTDAEMRNRLAIGREDITQKNRIDLEEMKSAIEARQEELKARKRSGILDAAASGMTPYEVESLTDDDIDLYDPEFGTLAAQGVEPSTIGSEAEGSEREIVSRGLLREFGADEAKKYLDATEPTTSNMSDVTKTAVAMGYKPGTPEFERMVLQLKGKGGTGKVGGWDQKSAASYFTSQAWKAIGKGVDEYGIPLGEVTAEDKNWVRRNAAEATQEWAALEGRADPTMIAYSLFGRKSDAAPADESAPMSEAELDAKTGGILEAFNLHSNLPDKLVPSGSRVSGTDTTESELRIRVKEALRKGESVEQVTLDLREFLGLSSGGGRKDAGPLNGGAASQIKTAPNSAQSLLDQARAAIAQGADPDAVKARLKENGIDPSQL